MDLTPIWPYVTFATIPAAAWAVVRASDRMELSWRRTAIRGVAKFVRFISLLLLVITIPSGSIDIPDIWVLGLFSIVPALLFLATRKARLIQRGWVRVIAGGVSRVLFGLTTVLFVGLCGFETGWGETGKSIYSPDRSRLAFVRVNLDARIETLSVRPSSRPIANPVWGPYIIKDKLEIKWLDNSRLLVRYFHNPGRRGCYPMTIGDVEVVCEFVPAPSR